MEMTVIVIIAVMLIVLFIVRSVANSKEEKHNASSATVPDGFVVSRQVGTYIRIDAINKKWCIPKNTTRDGGKYPKIYDYGDLLEYELLEDNVSITKGGLGAAAVGGLLFGGAGAVVGSVVGGKKTKNKVKNMSIKLVLRNIDSPVDFIVFYSNSEFKTDSFIYKDFRRQASEVLALLAIITEESKAPVAETVNPVRRPVRRPLQQNEKPAQIESNTDQLLKLKSLLDSGALTQSEFDSEKAKILLK
ncbi:MAG: SHOCT domain-containing protein [Oscillospiraceae bacterium]|jgi:hypothetical protein|nr:SHOCT domain-containing protein [Oscillospiraceae bacterium]